MTPVAHKESTSMKRAVMLSVARAAQDPNRSRAIPNAIGVAGSWTLSHTLLGSDVPARPGEVPVEYRDAQLFWLDDMACSFLQTLPKRVDPGSYGTAGYRRTNVFVEESIRKGVQRRESSEKVGLRQMADPETLKSRCAGTSAVFAFHNW